MKSLASSLPIPKKKRIILGIDPGSWITGYGLIQLEIDRVIPLDFGSIRPPKSSTISKRYLIIFTALEELIKQYQPSALSIETQYVYKNVASAMKLGMARGMVLLAAEKNEIPIFEYTPTQAKLAVAGSGAASKEQVGRMVQLLLNLSSPPKPLDAADALALALCHAHRVK